MLTHHSIVGRFVKRLLKNTVIQQPDYRTGMCELNKTLEERCFNILVEAIQPGRDSKQKVLSYNSWICQRPSLGNHWLFRYMPESTSDWFLDSGIHRGDDAMFNGLLCYPQLRVSQSVNRKTRVPQANGCPGVFKRQGTSGQDHIRRKYSIIWLISSSESISLKGGMALPTGAPPSFIVQ